MSYVKTDSSSVRRSVRRKKVGKVKEIEAISTYSGDNEIEESEPAPTIKITIETINNFDNLVLTGNLKYPLLVEFHVTFGKILVGTSKTIEITSRYLHTVEFVCSLELIALGDSFLQELCKQPFVISLAKVTEQNKEKKRSKGSLRGAHFPSEISFQLVEDICNSAYYQTNVDVLPILFGVAVIKETLVLRPKSEGTLMVDLRYPLIEITVSPVNFDSMLMKQPIANLISISLETLYNLNQDLLKNYPNCQAALHLLRRAPLDSEEDRFSVRFKQGEIVGRMKNLAAAKKWSTVAASASGASQSLYRTREDKTDVIYPSMKGGLQKDYYEEAMMSSSKNIKWNQFVRLLLSNNQEEKILMNLSKHRTWLLEFKFTKDVWKMQPKKKIQSPGKSQALGTSDSVFYVAYLDVGTFMHPGVNSLRTVAHIWTYNQIHVLERTGILEMILLKHKDESEVGDELFEKRMSKRKSAFKNVTIAKSKSDENEVSMPQKQVIQEPATEVMGNDFRPAFILVQIELYKPFVQRKMPTELPLPKPQQLNLIKSKIKKPTQRESWTAFQNSIYEMTRLILKEYNEYIINWKNKSVRDVLYPQNNQTSIKVRTVSEISVVEEIDLTPEEFHNKDFFGYLSNCPEYESLKKLISFTVNRYIEDFFPSKNIDSDRFKLMFQSTVYSRIMNDIHAILNATKIESEESDDSLAHLSTANEILQNAIEYSDLGYPDRAKSLLVKRLYFYGENNPDYWVDLANLCLHNGDSDTATQALHRALSLNPRTKEALIMYAIIMYEQSKFELSENFFNNLTKFFPRFYYGWLIFNVYYNLIENREGVDLTLAMASKCLTDLPTENQSLKFRKCTNVWNTDLLQIGNGYLETAVYLLSLSLHSFAESCLALELSTMGEKTLPYYYFLAACYHCQKNYIDCECILTIGLEEHLDFRLQALLGHNLYSLGRWQDAQSMYSCVENYPDASEDDFLIKIRIALNCINAGQPEEAKRRLAKLADASASAFSWLYLGKIYLQTGELEDSEKCFTVANRIDPTLPETWAYLAMISVENKRYALAERCLAEAERQGLKDPDLIKQVNSCFSYHGGQVINFCNS